jgi:hypothetical protein
MEFSIIFPIIALVIGWLLNELSRYFIFRYEMHGAIGKTLLNLLTTRNKMKNIQYYSNYLINTLNLPISNSEMRMFYRKLFPSNDELYQNMKESITTIASTDPVLALTLRDNIIGTVFFDKALSMVEGNEKEDQLFVNFISNLEDKTIPLLDSSILQLARKHGIYTFFHIKHHLKEELKVVPEMENMLKDFKKQLDEIKKF